VLAPGEHVGPRVGADRLHILHDLEERMSDTSLDIDLDRFVCRLRARLVAGAMKYGDASFRRPAAELVDEVQQELEDVCGWSLILWIRLERLRGRLAPAAERGGDEEA
jgi:hypothetical protein